MSELAPDSVLARITTRWSQVTNPVQFIARYAPAIQGYFRALIRHTQEAEDAAQDFLTKVATRGFADIKFTDGRFRDYLAVAVKNSAINHIKHRQRRKAESLDSAQVPGQLDDFSAADQEWLQQWHQCVLDMAWRKLHHFQRQTPGNLYHTVLHARMNALDQPDGFVAEQLSIKLGREMTSAAFRKTLSRARKAFGEYLIEEVAQTLNDPTPEKVQDELIATGLMTYVAPYLKDNWRTRGLLDDLAE